LEWEVWGPESQTSLLVAAAVAPPGVQVGPGVQAGLVVYRIFNDSGNTVFLAIGKDAATAQANAVVPTAGNPQNVLPIQPHSVEPFKAAPNQFWSGICPAGNSNVYITQGRGG
jgi:hypothetical protein